MVFEPDKMILFQYLPPFRSPKEIAINDIFYNCIPEKDIILHNLAMGYKSDWATKMPLP